MAVIKNYYKILGVEYDASEQDIRNAYRVLAKKYHPDLNQGDESAAAKFRNISEAQDILLDVAERSQHDILLQSKGVIMPHIEKQKEEARKQAEENAKANAEKSSSGDALKDELIRQARKKAQQRAQKDPRKMSKAERNAYAMKKVNESKAFKKKAIVLSSIAGGILVVGLALFFIITAILSTVTVTFVYNYNNEIVVEKVERNALIPTPTYYPTRDGYSVEGWYENESLSSGSKWDFLEYTATDDITLYANWEAEAEVETVSISFVYDGGMGNYTNSDGEVIYELPESLEIKKGYNTLKMYVSKSGYDLEGWYTDASFSTKFASTLVGSQNYALDMTLYAKWVEAEITVTLIDTDESRDLIYITYQTEKGVKVASSTSVEYYTEEDGNGIKIINADGTLAVDWNYTSPQTLYAYTPID